MASFRWGVLCQQAIVDKQTNLVSYMNVIEQFSPPNYPVESPNITVATLWDRDEEGEELNVRVSVVNESDEELEFVEGEPVTFDGFKRYRINRVIGGFTVENPGRVCFKISKEVADDDGTSKWQEVVRLPVDFAQPDDK
jgi:hypothetical protein